MAFAAKFKDELVECFDEDGTRMHPRYRSEVCSEGTRRWHGVADVWVVNRDGMILCTQRSPAVQNNPNKWQTLSGGHVKYENTFINTAVEELYEELGIKTGAEKLFLVEKGKSESRMHVFEHYVFLFDGGLKDLKFLDGETIEAKWFAFEAYKKDLEKHPEKWCAPLSDENYLKIMEWLKTQN
jgi:8-oxo-dGTP pyrophosphatase MutT (NUDIX family)